MVEPSTLSTPYSYRDDPDVPLFDDGKPVVIFDGQCVFCTGWAKVILARDKVGAFRLLVAQTELGEALYRHYGLKKSDYNTNILLVNGYVYIKSEGSIRMAEQLGFPYSMVKVLRLIPLALRDIIYDFVARNRFKIAGRKSVCYIPELADRDKFL